MKLTKQQALDLVKVLSHYETSTVQVDADVRSLRCDLEEFVLAKEETDEEADEEGEGAGEEADDEEDEEERSEQEDDASDEADDAGEEADEEGDDEEPTGYVRGDDLHALKPCKGQVVSSGVGDPDADVVIEFEHVSCGRETNVDVLINDGEDFIGPVTLIRRKGAELHIAEELDGNVTWHRFAVSRFPKGWADALPVNQLIEVDG